MPSSSLLALATAVTGASAAFQGFNYDNKGRNQQAFEGEFNNARNLQGTNGGFTSARLYTMIQDGTANDPISAIPAGINTKTSLLFGLWASAGQAQFNNEIAALKKTIDQYCDKLDGLVAGISVGSEDLYRDSPIGQAAGENPGAGPEVLSHYVDQVRDTIKGSCLEKIPIGHVDTWTAYANQTNREFSSKLDFVGMDAYPYYENQKDNSIDNAKALFQAAIDNTNAGTGNKPLWITETGWPVSGKQENKATSGLENAKTFWREVGCPRFGKVNMWWFTQEDGGISDAPAPRFGVVGQPLSTKPLFDLSCDGTSGGDTSSSTSSTTAPASSSISMATSSSAVQTGSSSTSAEHTSSVGSSTLSTTTSGATVPVTTGSASSTNGSGSQTSSNGSGGSGGSSSSAASTPVGSASKSSPATSPTIVPNSAAGLNSVAAAVAAVIAAAAAF